jgi:hypothetical protein
MNRRQALSLFVAPLALSVLSAAGLSAQTTAPTKLIVFGASMADAGNVHILTGGFFGSPPNWQGRSVGATTPSPARRPVPATRMRVSAAPALRTSGYRSSSSSRASRSSPATSCSYYRAAATTS